MKPQQLFRQAALENNQVKWLGDIVLLRPLSFSIMAAVAGFFAIMVLVFLFLGSYTKRSTASGQLVPDMGVLKVHAQQVGIVVKKMAAEGQQVTRGQVLFVLSSDRQNANANDTQASISRQVAARQASLREELRKTERILVDEKQALAAKIAAMQTESDKIASQLDGQKSRVKLAQDALARAQELLAQNFISKEQLQQKQADLLDQRNRLQAIERDQLSIGRELANERNNLQSLPLRHQNQLAQIERIITTTGQELTESEAKRSLIVSAPENGTVTAISAEVGQLIDPGKPMLSIVPQGARLLAELYIPSRAIGFVRKDSPVLLRYQAYPYQKFGHGRGKVLHVSKTALSGAELNAIATQGSNNSEPMYKVIVQLDAQTVHAYGKAEALQVGMLLEADVLQDTRRLYEWVLEPLYSLTGKL